MTRGLAFALFGTAALTGGLLAGFAPSPAEGYGLPPSGPVVDAGLPAMRVLALGACALAVGRLLAAVRTPAGRDGLLDPAGYAGLASVRRWSLVQAGASLTVAGLTVAENSGAVTPSTLFVGVRYIEPATGWLLCGLVAAGVAAAAGWVLTWRAAVGLLIIALAAPLGAALTATTNAQRSHDVAGDALAAQTLALVLLLAARAVSTGNRCASWCLAVAAAAASVSAGYAVAPGQLWSTGYGWLTLAGFALFGAAVLARRSWLPALALVCVHTALTRVAAPADRGYQASRQVYLLGYDLPGRMNWDDLALRWRPDLVFGSLAVLGAVVYLGGVRRLRRRGEPWSRRHTFAWLCGCAVLLVATSSGVGRYAPAVFSVHMAQHMLVAGLAPALLVLGHGGTLALRAGRTGGSANRLRALLDARAVRLAGHPLVAWLAVAGTLFGVYPTGLFQAWQQEHWAHLVMNSAFFLTGLALMRVVLGADGSLPPIGRLVMVFAVMALHAGFAAWLLGLGQPLGEAFYRSLALPFVPDPLADQRLGALLSWLLGEVPVVLAVVALVRRWTADDEHTACEQPHVFTRSGTPRAAELTGRV